MGLFSHLIRPFGYLSIRGINGKLAYDWLAPLFLSILSCGYFYLAKIPFTELNNDGGFIKSITAFISNLPGFYIAALAAIATFNREQIDYPLVSDNATPYVYIKGVKENGKTFTSKEDLTRRLFLCMLFSFLTALSISIVVINAFANPLLDLKNNEIFFITYTFLFLFLVWQLLVATFFGLYYLGDRIHVNY